MKYGIRQGIVLVEICGAPILVAKRQLWEDFPHIRTLSGIEKMIWKLLDNGSPWEQILRIVSSLTRSVPEKVEPKLKELCDSLVKDGYMIEISDKDVPNDVV